MSLPLGTYGVSSTHPGGGDSEIKKREKKKKEEATVLAFVGPHGLGKHIEKQAFPILTLLYPDFSTCPQRLIQVHYQNQLI